MGGRILSLGGIWTWNIIDYLQLELPYSTAIISYQRQSAY